MSVRRRALIAIFAVALAVSVERVGARLLHRAPGPVHAPTAVVLPAGSRAELHSAPARSAPARPVQARTPFGSPRTLPVIGSDGPWLKVLGNGAASNRPAWLHIAAGQRTRMLPTQVLVDISDETLFVLRGSQVVAAFKAASGEGGTPTPPGRYAVTDELSGPRFSTAYGCCIVALSGRQTRLPADWQGGDRLAIHGTPTGVPQPSLGCVTLANRAMRVLTRLIRRGTVVTIRA